MRWLKYSDCCVYFKGVYCIINATLGLHRDGGRAILVSESGSLSCLVCFHFKLIISSNSLCLHYPLIPLSSLIKRAFIFSLIFIYLSIYLFIYYAFRHKTASACVESKLLIFLFFALFKRSGAYCTALESKVEYLLSSSCQMTWCYTASTQLSTACAAAHLQVLLVSSTNS